MEQFLDLLLAYLLATPGLPASTQFILGDPGMSAPTSWPFIYVVPLFDQIKGYSGVDMDTYAVPILIVDDLHNYGAPIANVNVPGAMEQPGYRKLMQYAQAVRNQLRKGGQGITVGGIAATSTIPAITYVWVRIDTKVYRGARVALTVQQRRARG